MTKNQGSKMGASDHAEGPKNYLRTTIAMQQHSVKRMNKELLRYSLQQPSKYSHSKLNSFFYRGNWGTSSEWSPKDRGRRC